MPDITTADKIVALRRLLPKDKYSLDEVALFLGYIKKKSARKSAAYWCEVNEVSTIKINNSPFVLQESFILGIIRADKKNRNENKRQGLDFAIEDQKEFPK